MAVPKKKTSRSKRDTRRNNWIRKVNKAVLVAISLAKSRFTEKITV